MNEFEIKNENLKMRWVEKFKIEDNKYTQVSAYIFNEKNQLLIVKGEKNWTIPGGHPEYLESHEDTLNREVMEESCVTIKDIKYIGAVEVVENNDTYFQLRYFARVNEILPFSAEWEKTERLFIDLEDISRYIKWHDGITFKAELESAIKYL